MSDESDVEKTEEPTPQRRQKAREEGQIPRSKELTSLLMLLAGWSLIFISGERTADRLAQLLHDGLVFDRLLIADPTRMLHRASELLSLMLTALLPLLLGLFFVAIASGAIIGGLHFSTKSLKVDLARLSPFSGFKRLFSFQVVSELMKSLMKATLVGCAFIFYLIKNKSHFLQLDNESLSDSLHDAHSLISHCLLMVICALIPMVGYDVFYQLMSHVKKLRMSRQEIRDEFKQSEGDPHVKGRIKQLRRTLAQSRMMESLPDADVIVNNPTHYSVAIRWQEGKMSAPVVLAKGAGDIALRIREKGAELRIPMLEAAPLARALYRHCEPGDPIPTELYSVVAEVLAWVYRLRRWHKAGGSQPKKPENLSVPPALDFAHESQE
ncbi:flagellar biosynthetic protein FlhB [Enterobacter sp. BIGb0383]|uniref:flagellar biosynthesis protein FlhB n=1 Tax=unclassified Enterobacter TaxID=2608935 RepID=UPI000F4A40B3|nr:MULTISPECIES: flagellar biosynthesis protein FlhB [unclassified Enterobacter]ROP58322.1 flagellar biosynthetic protein FlhB [Enterobacter sp. BIGb0383]ROS06790.1 flagellar biosynthetic protein FlhB [Enterobacter sp. BIGb0359]